MMGAVMEVFVGAQYLFIDGFEQSVRCAVRGFTVLRLLKLVLVLCGDLR